MTELKEPPRQLNWPAAATLISAIIGGVATSIALAISPGSQIEFSAANRYATSREMGEVKARLEAIEVSNQQMRTELRSDVKELRELIRQLLNRH